MKDFFIALKNNLSNLFSIIGILLTIYFSVYYIPQYSEAIRINKIESINNSLISIIQELVYNDHPIDEKDLKTMIEGKEIKGSIIYPYNIDELLIQTQDRFLENKFIPLEQRKALVDKIDTIRDKLSSPESIEKAPEVKSSIIYEKIVPLIGILLSVIGMLSIWAKAKKQKEYELEDKLEETKESLKQQVVEGVFLESEVFNALKEVTSDSNIKHGGPDSGVDFIVRGGSNKRIGIEAKYTETDLIPVRTISNLIATARHRRIPILLITNAPLTKNANKKLEDYNRRFPKTNIDVLVIKETGELKNEIKNYINAIV
ncbi:MAG: restriction endonuclease [Candidatus Tenebribacter mawsonii]|nr:restriction endonuclease [Candidatus Tenebribacter mawsonii]